MILNDTVADVLRNRLVSIARIIGDTGWRSTTSTSFTTISIGVNIVLGPLPLALDRRPRGGYILYNLCLKSDGGAGAEGYLRFLFRYFDGYTRTDVEHSYSDTGTGTSGTLRGSRLEAVGSLHNLFVVSPTLSVAGGEATSEHNVYLVELPYRVLEVMERGLYYGWWLERVELVVRTLDANYAAYIRCRGAYLVLLW